MCRREAPCANAIRTDVNEWTGEILSIRCLNGHTLWPTPAPPVIEPVQRQPRVAVPAKKPHPTKPHPLLANRTCANSACGLVFWPYHHRQRYCSSGCGGAASATRLGRRGRPQKFGAKR